MNQPFHKEFTITDIHVDPFRRLKPAVLLYFIQEVSGRHADLLGTDWQTLHEKGLFWAIIRHKVEICRLPEAGETIILETWPMPTTRVAYPRATAAYDSNGTLLFRSHALWVLMDTNARTMVLPGKSGVTVDGWLAGNELDAPGSLPPKTMENSLSRTVTYAELDRNLHMNNTHYMDWVDSLLPSAFHRDHPVKEFTVCYLSEALEGQKLALHWMLDGEGFLCVEAHRNQTEKAEKEERIFAASICF